MFLESDFDSGSNAFRYAEAAVLEVGVLSSCRPSVASERHVVSICLHNKAFFYEIVGIDFSNTFEPATEGFL